MPLIPRVGPGEVVPLRRVQPQDVGSGAGQNAFGQAADALSSVTAQLQTAEQTARVASGLAGVSAKLDELRMGLDQDPDHDGREQKFEAARAGVLKEFRDKIKGGAFQADFDARAFQIGERQKLAVREGVIRTRLDIARGDLLMGVDSLVDQASKTDSDVIRSGLLEQADQLMAQGVDKGAITASQWAELKIRHDRVLEQADERRTLGTVREQIRLDPAQALRDLQDPDSQLASGLDKLQRGMLIGAAEDAVKAQAAEARARLRESKEAVAEVHEASLQDGLDLLERGELTADWLTSNADMLGSTNRMRLRKLLGDGPGAADPAELNRLNRLAIDNPVEFGTEDLDPTTLGTSYKTMLTLQRTVREKGFVDSQTLSLKTRVTARSAAMSLDDAETMEFDRRVNEEIEEFITRNGGKRPDRAQQDAIVDGLSLEVRGSKGFDFLGLSVSGGRMALEGQSINGVPGPLVEILTDDLEDQGARITTDVLFNRFSAIAKDLQANSLPVTEDTVSRYLALERQRRSKP